MNFEFLCIDSNDLKTMKIYEPLFSYGLNHQVKNLRTMIHQKQIKESHLFKPKSNCQFGIHYIQT